MQHVIIVPTIHAQGVARVRSGPQAPTPMLYLLFIIKVKIY
jgi:hypothetical protein